MAHGFVVSMFTEAVCRKFAILIKNASRILKFTHPNCQVFGNIFDLPRQKAYNFRTHRVEFVNNLGITLLLAGFSCKTASTLATMTQKSKDCRENIVRSWAGSTGATLWAICMFLERIGCEAFILENVPGLLLGGVAYSVCTRLS